MDIKEIAKQRIDTNIDKALALPSISGNKWKN
jgi:hypothetical protein